MGSHSVHTHWMYQYCVLYLAWWWFSEPKHVAEIFSFNIDYQYMLCYWLNKLLYYCKTQPDGSYQRHTAHHQEALFCMCSSWYMTCYCREYKQTNFTFSNFFPPKILPFTRKRGKHTKCIVVFPLQQCWHGIATILRYTYIVCLVNP